MLQHAQVVQRMDLARDQIRERAHACLSQGLVWQERRPRVPLLEIFHDGERLAEARAVVELEGREQGLRVHPAVLLRAMLALCQMNEHRLVGEPLEVKGDADAESRRAAEIGIQLHKAGSIFTLSSPTPSMPACSSSPGFTGPTPAGVPE